MNAWKFLIFSFEKPFFAQRDSNFSMFILLPHRYIIPYFYIAEFLGEYGISEEKSAYLISIIGIFNTVGMIALGWVGDQKWCNVTKTYGVCLLCKYGINFIG